MDKEEMRKAFEEWFSEGGKWPKSVERDEKGQYILMSAANAWIAWQAAMAHSCEALTNERDALRRALEVIAVGDSKDPVTDAGDELVALGYWRAESVAAMRRHGG